MRNLIKKTDWRKFRIRSRKDWVIFWGIVVCICYAAGVHYADRPDRWLFHFSNPYMINLNQPRTWGQLMVCLPLLAIVTEVVLFLCNKPVKAKILVLVGALLMPVVIVAGYRIHTDLIVSSLWKEEPRAINIFCRSINSEGRENRIELAGEECKELLALCRDMTPISDQDDLEMLRHWYQENNGERYMQGSSIQMTFMEKYGHSYAFWLNICDGKVYLWRGYNSSMQQEITFFEDNGIVERIEEIIAADTSQTAGNSAQTLSFQ